VARVRTEEKRADIVRIASEMFNELGYDRCSMDAICGRVGGSKATLYGYFDSKEELLRAVLQCEVAGTFYRLMHEFDEAEDLRTGLIGLGIAYHNKRLSSLPAANMRAVLNQPPGSNMGQEFYETVIRPGFQGLAKKFEDLMDQGLLKRADPWTVTMHWKGLNDWDLFEQRLLGAISGPQDVDVEKVATLAAEAFIKLYGVDEEDSEKTKRN
jgi:AcrR family transcriptional regulator